MTATEREEAYADGRERLLDELLRAELLLRRHLEAWWAERGTDDGFRGLYVSDEEVDRLLAAGVPESQGGTRRARDADRRTVDGDGTAGGDGNGGSDVGPDGRSGDGLDGALARVTRRIEMRAERTREAGRPTRLGQLAAGFDLDRRELDALVLALAPDLDGKYEKVYGYLQDDVTLTRPGVGLLLRVVTDDRRDRLASRHLFEPGSTLVDEGLVSVPADAATFVSRSVRVPRRVASYLVGGDDLPGVLADAATVVEPDGEVASLPVPDERRDRLDAVRDGGDDPVVAAFVGPDEVTAEEAVRAVSGKPLIRVDAVALAGEDRGDLLGALVREVHLRDAGVHVRNLGALDGSESRSATGGESGDGDGSGEGRSAQAGGPGDLVVALDAVPGEVFLTGEVDLSARFEPRLSEHAFARVAFPRPDRARREALWRDIDDLPDDADPSALAAAYRLTRGQIEDAVATARSLADGPLTASTLRAGCRAHARHRLDDLAREIDPGYGWDDIVLPPDTMAHLREAAAHVRNRGTVYEDWGFTDEHTRGNGINLLFTGPSGTGKTMAAEVIASDAGLPLYALDLSSVMSKYIGETEKNLRRVFDEAEHSNAILFFDEADALFGERSEVSDSHDRYANVEVDYLLQRMETHDGAVVLASNLAENIDDAFRRRINLTVEFPRPDRAARADIWRGVFPAATPVGDLDVDFLAGFELSGGDIKNVATTAAFAAAEDGEPVEMRHLVGALRRELQKSGRLFEPSDFGEYRQYL